MPRRKLPLGIQSFQKLRKDDCYYVDKTRFIEQLIQDGTHYFLSRPRRFGKSLLLDTMKELFEGNQDLFKRLSIHDRWDWETVHPVIRLSFAGGHFLSPEGVSRSVTAQLDRMEQQFGLRSSYSSLPERFSEIIHKVHKRDSTPVVVLIDEYDKPMLDALDKPDVARGNRDFLRGLYGTIKDCDAYIRFSFITGVTKFSKVSLFSGLNNLIDITIDPTYSEICGYTEYDLDEVFSEELNGLDRDKIREWYNGYSWRGTEKIYNPYDILLLFFGREFKAHWFETGTPAFLVDTLTRQRVSSLDIDGKVVSEELLSTFDVDEIAPEALLFQSGYLTIVSEEQRAGELVYRLAYPNREVRQAVNRSLLSRLVGSASRRETHSAKLYELLIADNLEAMQDLFHAFYASIPHEWYTNNDIARFEGFYASVFYSYFAGLGLDVVVEDSTNHGRLDMGLRFKGRAYIFEFKVVEQAGEGSAMAQLKQRNYADKYLNDSDPVRLIAVEFSSETRNIESFEVQSV